MEPIKIILLLLAGYIVLTIDKKKKLFPGPPVLVLIGIGLSFIGYFASLHIGKEILYEIFLPSLLFISAYRFPPAALKKNAGMIGFLSTAGLLITALLLGAAIYYFANLFVTISFLGSLMIAAILTPTDPVSVISILKEASSDPRVSEIVEGESMINDGTSFVLFTVLTGMFAKGESFSVLSFAKDFLFVSLGGIFLGLICGWIVSKAVHVTERKDYQVMLSIILSYGIFYAAELAGVSGVLATVSAGIMLSWEFNHTNKEDHYLESLDSFWGIIEPTIISLVFLMIGIEATSHLTIDQWGIAFVIFAMSILIRFAVIHGTVLALPKERKLFSWRESTIISWAGIKGTMSVVLLLILDAAQTTRADMIISLTFTAVILSLIIQSSTIYPLSKALIKK